MNVTNRLAGAAILSAIAIAGFNSNAFAAPPPVYVHMNGANEFLEDVVAVQPGQKLVFVNEDTGEHTLIGYNPATGATTKGFDGMVAGTKGAGHKVATYSISFKHQGLQYYYCSVHALLKQEPGGTYVPMLRPHVDGFGYPMGGLIIVTTDKKLLAENPKTASEKILPSYFGG